MDQQLGCVQIGNCATGGTVPMVVVPVGRESHGLRQPSFRGFCRRLKDPFPIRSHTRLETMVPKTGSIQFGGRPT